MGIRLKLYKCDSILVSHINFKNLSLLFKFDSDFEFYLNIFYITEVLFLREL